VWVGVQGLLKIGSWPWPDDLKRLLWHTVILFARRLVGGGRRDRKTRLLSYGNPSLPLGYFVWYSLSAMLIATVYSERNLSS
jgi:hypothetical protein